MTGLIIGGIVLAHVTIALTIARAAYGRFRLWQVENPPQRCTLTTVHSRLTRAAICLTLGCLLGLWPLLFAAAVVVARPPKTPRELKREAAERDQRIADLERDLGIRR